MEDKTVEVRAARLLAGALKKNARRRLKTKREIVSTVTE